MKHETIFDTCCAQTGSPDRFVQCRQHRASTHRDDIVDFYTKDCVRKNSNIFPKIAGIGYVLAIQGVPKLSFQIVTVQNKPQCVVRLEETESLVQCVYRQ